MCGWNFNGEISGKKDFWQKTEALKFQCAVGILMKKHQEKVFLTENWSTQIPMCRWNFNGEISGKKDFWQKTKALKFQCVVGILIKKHQEKRFLTED